MGLQIHHWVVFLIRDRGPGVGPKGSSLLGFDVAYFCYLDPKLWGVLMEIE